MSHIKFGKYTIENLTTAMYSDSRIVFREYIQNAADQIDFAKKTGLFSNDNLFIDISIDAANRKITIFDNATGIPKELVKKKLADVADSDKEKGETKGFRGIGRLGGLAYCDKLRFITSAKGEKEKTIMTWDAKKMRAMIEDSQIKDDAASVLESIISYAYEPCEEEEHFFVVELDNIVSDEDKLLDAESLKKYIAIDAPVPYSNKLYLRDKIYAFLSEQGFPKNEYTVYVSTKDSKEDLLKPYTTTLYEAHPGSKKRYDEIFDISIKTFKNTAGEVLAWLWYGISTFDKVIDIEYNETAGIRIRQHNIQIGNERTLVKFFKESRGNFYFVGELHAVHSDLIPNARRDYFIENSTCRELESQIEEYFYETCHRLYHGASDVKNAFKKEIKLYKAKEILDKKAVSGFVPNEKVKLENDVLTAEEEYKKAQKIVERMKRKAQSDTVLKAVITKLEENHSKKVNEQLQGVKTTSSPSTLENNQSKKQKYLVDELSMLDGKQRKLVSKIYAVIKQNLPDKTSEELINIIHNELKK